MTLLGTYDTNFPNVGTSYLYGASDGSSLSLRYPGGTEHPLDPWQVLAVVARPDFVPAEVRS